MVDGLEALAEMEYPGRFIAIGLNAKSEPTVVYGITGRSPSSQARRLVTGSNEKSLTINVEVTDQQVLRTGNQDLLVYSPLIGYGGKIAVSNGKQTDDIAEFAATKGPLDALRAGHLRHTHEPDGPHFTSRISGCLIRGRTNLSAALATIKRSAEGASEYHFSEVPLIKPEMGRFISTYDGRNTQPQTPFSQHPLAIAIPGKNVRETRDAFYELFAPQQGKPDFRVAVTVVSLKDKGFDYSILNRN